MQDDENQRRLTFLTNRIDHITLLLHNWTSLVMLKVWLKQQSSILVSRKQLFLIFYAVVSEKMKFTKTHHDLFPLCCPF